MPPSDRHGLNFPFASFRRSIMSRRTEQVHSETSHDSNFPTHEPFQRRVFERFHDLSVANADEFLSVSWIDKLIDAFTSSQEDFRILLYDNRSLLSKAPADKLVSDYFDRTVKAMDIFNATRDGVETVRMWQGDMDIIVTALGIQQKMIGDGQLRRARRALMDLALLLLGDRDTGSVFSHRNRSFGRKGKDRGQSSSGHSRSLSWSVSHSWSASKQLQSIANHLVPPRPNEIAATNGLAVLIFVMSFILLFVLWALTAAIPCQDRNVQINFTIPRQYPWSTPLFLLHTRIMDESKKKDRRHSCGLLKEIYQIEKCVHQLTDLVDSAKFPLSEEVKEEVRKNVDELSFVYQVFNNGLEPLERKLRETFRKTLTCRCEGLEFVSKHI